MGRAGYLNPAGFGARAAYSAVATVLLVLAIRGSAGSALNPRYLGGLRAFRDDPVGVYLNGSRVAGQPGSVMLTPHLAIVVSYRPGSVAIPARYAFPAGT